MTTSKGVDVTLKLVGLTGLAGLSLVAPNAVQALDILLRRTTVPESDYGRIMKELRRQGLIDIHQQDERIEFILTPAGAYRLAKVTVGEIQILLPKYWDKKWRMVIFDIPVNKSVSRKYFTEHIQRLGFHMIQRSTWVYPYPCFTQITEVASYYNVLRYCSFIEISSIDELTTRRLVGHFKSILTK